jgi:hypothetical protein
MTRSRVLALVILCTASLMTILESTDTAYICRSD